MKSNLSFMNETLWNEWREMRLSGIGLFAGYRPAAHMLHSFPFQSSLSLFHFNSFPLSQIEIKEKTSEPFDLFCFSLLVSSLIIDGIGWIGLSVGPKTYNQSTSEANQSNPTKGKCSSLRSQFKMNQKQKQGNFIGFEEMM